MTFDVIFTKTKLLNACLFFVLKKDRRQWVFFLISYNISCEKVFLIVAFIMF